MVQFETVRMMIVLAALKDWHISGLDVKTAFLYGELDEELYMEQPEGFKDPKNNKKVMHLKKAIYGLKQATLAVTIRTYTTDFIYFCVLILES